MDLQVLLPILGNLGAPLSVSVMLFYLMYRQQKAMHDSLARALTIIERLAGVNDCPEPPVTEKLPDALDRIEQAAMNEAQSATRPVPLPIAQAPAHAGD